MLTLTSKKRALFIWLVIVALLAISIILAMFVKQSPHESNRHPLDSNNTVYLNGFTYTVTRAFHTSKMGFKEGRNGAAYLIVDLKLKNPKSKKVKHDAEFHLLNREGNSYDLDNATMFVGHGSSLEFKIMPKSSKLVTLVFTVPTENLNQPLTLDIQNKNGETSSGMIKIGPATKALAQD